MCEPHGHTSRMNSLPPELAASVKEAREYLAAFPGVDHLPLNLFTQIVARGGDGMKIESMLLSERRSNGTRKD